MSNVHTITLQVDYCFAFATVGLLGNGFFYRLFTLKWTVKRQKLWVGSYRLLGFKKPSNL